MPTALEVERHCLTHVPYRSWCPHCVRGRGKEMNHDKKQKEHSALKEFAFDYCFPGDENGNKLTILVGKERRTGMRMATVVPTKGSSGQFAVEKAEKFIRECGAGAEKILIKSDQEPAIKVFVEDLVKVRGEASTILEWSPVASSGSNGVVERGVQEVEGVMRSMRSALEERIGEKVAVDERVVTFMAEHAAYLLNRLDVGVDGKTAYERNKGKKATVLGVEFGEKLLYKVRRGAKSEKLNSRWEYGIFVGVKKESGELWVATPQGITAARSVKRIVRESRWSKDCKAWVRHVPWHRAADDAAADGDIPEDARPNEPILQERPRLVVVNTRLKEPRDFHIRQKDIEKHGYTRNCAGCLSIVKGMTRQAHGEDCRNRFRELMKDEEKVLRTSEKRKEYEAIIEGKEAKREEKKRTRREGRAVTPGSSHDHQKNDKKRKAEDDDIEAERIREPVPEEDVDQMIQEVVEELDVAWDDVNGGELDKRKVDEARREEVKYMQARGLWKVVAEEDSWVATGAAPISVKWVDTNKGSLEEPMIRSRLVARDFRSKDRDREDLFAATPPLELKRLLLSKAVEMGPRGVRKLLFVDAKKAHLNPKCEGDVFIQLPKEAGGAQGTCGKLVHWLYGFRPAAQAWENFYAEKLVEAGFERGVASPVAFYHKGRDVACVVHGDDFTFCAASADLDWIEALLPKWFEVKVRARLGPDERDDKEVVILGRLVRWTSWGISYEADPRHRELVLQELGLGSESKGLALTGAKENINNEQDGVLLDVAEAKRFRALAARLNYMAQDAPDVQYACKEICADMAAPRASSWGRMKSLARYLVNRRCVQFEFAKQRSQGPSTWRVYTDSDWGGCRRSRKSTSGGAVMLGDHCIKTWSSTQGAVALSVCEAEYYALVEGASRVKGIAAMAKELGIEAEVEVMDALTDSSSAKSFASRRGAGRIRHIEVRWLWLQDEVAKGRVKLRKVAGERNPADILTKYLGLTDIKSKLETLGIRLRRRDETWELSGSLKPGHAWADVEDDSGLEDEVDDEGLEEVIAGIACGDCSMCGQPWSACGRQTTAEGGCRQTAC